mmetsp:Transcript_23073/g.33791  ORF Transcript_23073/g.33791 Transcript_23073/m.33791 type:complete len:282 (-) Transcript_23073:170-1015(-)
MPIPTTSSIIQSIHSCNDSTRGGIDTDARAVKEDLLALGIDIDCQIITRMQNLGLGSTWSATSQAASSLRKRNPHGVPSSVAYQNLSDPMEATHQEKREVEKEWDTVDVQKIHNFLNFLQNPSSHINRSTRTAVLNLIQIFKIQYARSSDKFIETILGIKNKKGLIQAGQIMRTRYIEHNAFADMIVRLHRQATSDQILVIFNALKQSIDIGGISRVVVDLKAFLLLLQVASQDSRRSFGDKSSKIANDVEFWNQRRARIRNGPTDNPILPGASRSSSSAR